jgi:hypothetical protein
LGYLAILNIVPYQHQHLLASKIRHRHDALLCTINTHTHPHSLSTPCPSLDSCLLRKRAITLLMAHNQIVPLPALCALISTLSLSLDCLSLSFDTSSHEQMSQLLFGIQI